MKIELANRTIWQQACGDKRQNYASVCVEWGVILNGPGSFGKWPDCIGSVLEDRPPRKGTDLKRFCEIMKPGDLVLLRLGTNTIVAIGEIVGDYLWSESFGDIDGWDIEHVRRVKWFWADTENPKLFPTYSLKFGDTTQISSHTQEVNEWITSLEIPLDVYNRDLPLMPFEWDSSTTIQNAGDHLYNHGTSNTIVNSILSEFDELVRISKWYLESRNFPSEPETIAYLVVPLLRALGWSPQKMAIEWNNVDIALFDQLPRTDDHLCVVVECKRMRETCLTAYSQAALYASTRPNCSRLIVTDGNRYGVFLKMNNKFVLSSYLNLQRLRSEYPVYHARGIQEALLMMTPEYKVQGRNSNTENIT